MVGIWWNGQRDTTPSGRFANEEGAHLRWSFIPELGFPQDGFDLQRRPSDGSSGWMTLNAARIHPTTAWGDEVAVTGEMWHPHAVERIHPDVWSQFRDTASETPFTDLVAMVNQARLDHTAVLYFVEPPDPAEFAIPPAEFYTNEADRDTFLASYYAGDDPKSPLSTWEMVPMQLIMTMALFPDIARLVGLYYIDKGREPDIEYDYRVVGYWTDRTRDYTVYRVSAPRTLALDQPVLSPPVTPVPIGQLAGNPVFDDRAVSLKWVPPTMEPADLVGPIDKIDSVTFTVEHKVLLSVDEMEFGEGDPPPTCPATTTTDGFAVAKVLDFESGELVDADPVIVNAIEDENVPELFHWPESYFTHRSLPYGCHAYRLVGRDVFGRPSPFSTPRVVNVVDVTPPPPPTLVSASVYQREDKSLSSDVVEMFFPESGTHTFVVLVWWVWPEAAAKRAGDVARFKVHVNYTDYSTFVQPSNPDVWRDSANWDRQALVMIEVSNTAKMPQRYVDIGLTEPANRYYAVALTDSANAALKASLETRLGINVVHEIATLAVIGLDAGDIAPVKYGHTGVSSVDRRPYENEGAVSAPAVILARDLIPPPRPTPPPFLSGEPADADKYGNSSLEMSWSATSLYTYALFRLRVAELEIIRDDLEDADLPACMVAERPVRGASMTDAEWAEVIHQFNIRATASIQPERFLQVSAFPIKPSGGSAAYRDTVDATVSSQLLYATAAIDKAGNRSELSCPSDLILVADRMSPRPPVIRQALGGDGETTLTWDQNRESDLARYEIYRTDNREDATSRRRMALIASLDQNGRDVTGPPDTADATLGGTNPYTFFTFTDAAVKPGTAYFYRIDAQDIAGNRSELSGIVTAKAVDRSPPAPPLWADTPVVVGTTGDGLPQVTLSWRAVADAPELRIQVQRKTAASSLWQTVGGGWQELGALPITDSTGLRRGHSYLYRIRAMDLVGNRSEWAENVLAVIPP
jgi:hypothetical protein